MKDFQWCNEIVKVGLRKLVSCSTIKTNDRGW